MTQIEADSSSLEYVVRPLVEVANTKYWKSALNILYASGSTIVISEELQIPCLVSAKGPINETEHSMELLTGRAKVGFMPLIKGFVKMFLPSIQIAIGKRDVSNAVEKKQENVPILITELLPELEKHENDLMRIIVQGASKLSDLIVVRIFKFLAEFRNGQLRSSFDELAYEEMIGKLMKLGLIEPRLQISLCPECANYHLTISPRPSTAEECPKCGNAWAVITLYVLQSHFSEIKIDNSDLSLFISSYLRYRLDSKVLVGEVKVMPKARVRADDNKTFDIDVYLPEFNVGIECKVFEDAFAPMTQPRLESIAGRLKTQIRNYLSVGIREVIIATNLPESSRSSLESALKGAFKTENINIDVLQGDIEILLKKLDDLASRIAKTVGTYQGALPEHLSAEQSQQGEERMPERSD